MQENESACRSYGESLEHTCTPGGSVVLATSDSYAEYSSACSSLRSRSCHAEDSAWADVEMLNLTSSGLEPLEEFSCGAMAACSSTRRAGLRARSGSDGDGSAGGDGRDASSAGCADCLEGPGVVDGAARTDCGVCNDEFWPMTVA
eukprot:5321300-Pleurochrysis_carterae.AAC.2